MENIRYYTDGEQATAEVLNRPLEDLEYMSQIPSKNEYDEQVNSRKKIYPISGFVEWGAGDENPNTYTINKGMTCRANDGLNEIHKNLFLLGPNSFGGLSSNKIPKINMNGDYIELFQESLSISSGDYGIPIKLPEAPSVKQIITNSSDMPEIKPGDTFLMNEGSRNLLGDNDWDTTYTTITLNGDNDISVSCDDSINTLLYHKNFEMIPYMEYKITVEFKEMENYNGSSLQIRCNSNTQTTWGSYYKAPISWNQDDGNIVKTAIIKGNYNGEGLGFTTYGTTGETSYRVVIKVEQNKPQPIFCSSYLAEGINLYKTNNVKRIFAASENLSRQDIVIIESWHEDISEKGVVYPFGNVQYQGTQIGTAYGTFSGYDTYSLRGSWEEPGSIIGKCLIWNDMTTEEKIEFASETKNNIYRYKNIVYQVRYRTRIIAGMGNNWYNYNTDTNKNTLSYNDSHLRIRAWGKRFTTDYIYNHPETMNRRLDYQGTHHLWSVNSNSHITSIDKEKYSVMPIAIVQRRNDAAFDPVWNIDGCGTFSDGKKWYDTSASRNSLIDCINNKLNGTIESGISGRPDNLYYDCIDYKDIKDLRLNAIKKSKEDILNEEFIKIIKGENRGENRGASYVKVAKLKSKGGNAVELLETSKFQNSDGAISSNYFSFSVDIVHFYNETAKTWHTLKQETGSSQAYHVHLNYTSGGTDKNVPGSTGSIHTYGALYNPINFNVDDIITVYVERKSGNYMQNNYELVCDVIGDPANYPTEWAENGFMGRPLTIRDYSTSADVASNYPTVYGISQLPADVGMSTDNKWKPFKLSRKFKSIKAVIVTKSDGSVKAFDPDSNGGSTIDGIDWRESYNEIFINWNNFLTAGSDDDVIIEVYYYTKADITLKTPNSDSLLIGDVYSIGNDEDWVGNHLTQHLINKVCVDNNVGTKHEFIKFDRLHSYYNDNDLTMFEMGENCFLHPEIKLDQIDIAYKMFPYISTYGGYATINIVFKELIWGNDYNNIETYTAGVSDDFIKGNIYRLQGFDNTEFNNKIFHIEASGSTGFDADTLDDHYIDTDGYIRSINNNNKLNGQHKLWNGNGWGDDNTFDIVNYVGTTKDDNDKVIVRGQRMVRLPYFLD